MYGTKVLVDTHDIQVHDPLNPRLFSDVAEAAARKCQCSDKNKSSQIRRFYDELVSLNDRVQNNDSPETAFERVAPFVQMLRAKAAYAKGRGLINDEFYERFKALVQQIDSPVTLNRAKLFFEAFLGFKKAFEEERK